MLVALEKTMNRGNSIKEGKRVSYAYRRRREENGMFRGFFISNMVGGF